MSHRVVLHPHHRGGLYAFLAILVACIIAVLLVGVGEVAFERIGFSSVEYALILIGTLVGSTVNIPVTEVRSTEPLLEMHEVRAFGLYYRIPGIGYRQVSTIVAVNVGGAVIPVLVSAYLLVSHPSALPAAIAGSLVTALFVHLVARKVRGVGIVTPALLPPVVAALAAYLFAPGAPAVVAYVSGTLGALIGADLTNLRGMGRLGAPMASIGGAGTFDGVFLTGIVAVLLIPLL